MAHLLLINYDMRRICFSFLALALFAGVYGSAIFGCGGGAKSIGEPIPEPDTGPQKGVIHYIDDHLGNAHLITDSQGNILREESRYPYGLDWRIDGNDVTTADYVYTGKEYDEETGLVYFGGRYYSPEMGRWITPDPLFLEKPSVTAERPLESNLYSFTRGNPIVFVDSDGLGSFAVTGGPFDVSHGVPDSWYRYGGVLLDVTPNLMNVGANVVGYATYGAERVLNYAGTDLNEVTFALMAIGPHASVSARYAFAWAGGRMAESAAILTSESGAIRIGGAFSTKDIALGLYRDGLMKHFRGLARIANDFPCLANKDGGPLIGKIEQAIHQAVDEGGKIRFNLQGTDWKNAFDITSKHYTKYTSQELRLIASDPKLKANTIFYNAGEGGTPW